MGTLQCEACGVLEDECLIDCKPSRKDGTDFDRHACIACYGSGYSMLRPDHVALSVVPRLRPLDEAWIERDRARQAQAQEGLARLAEEAAAREKAATEMCWDQERPAMTSAPAAEKLTAEEIEALRVAASVQRPEHVQLNTLAVTTLCQRGFLAISITPAGRSALADHGEGPVQGRGDAT